MTVALASALQLILPGGEGFPGASAIDLAGRLSTDAKERAAVASFEACLPADFGDLPATAQLEQLIALEARDPALFKAFLVAAYSHYYAHPAVLEVLARLTGYVAGPPQPKGYELGPFDETMLAVSRRRPRGYRPV